MARVKMIQISDQYFVELKEYANDFRKDAKKVRWAIDRAVMGYAMVTLGFAQKKSMGPLMPQARYGRVGALQAGPRAQVQFGHISKNYSTFGRKVGGSGIITEGAWKIPVRRITGAYLAGWKVRHIGVGIWETYNDSREAYFIEFGINHRGTGLTSTGGLVRIRRPVLKLSVMQAVAFARGTKMPIKEFLGAFSLSSYSSAITNMTPAAAGATIKAGEGFVYGAINAGFGPAK